MFVGAECDNLRVNCIFSSRHVNDSFWKIQYLYQKGTNTKHNNKKFNLNS